MVQMAMDAQMVAADSCSQWLVPRMMQAMMPDTPATMYQRTSER